MYHIRPISLRECTHYILVRVIEVFYVPKLATLDTSFHGLVLIWPGKFDTMKIIFRRTALIQILRASIKLTELLRLCFARDRRVLKNIPFPIHIHLKGNYYYLFYNSACIIHHLHTVRSDR